MIEVPGRVQTYEDGRVSGGPDNLVLLIVSQCVCAAGDLLRYAA